MLETRLVQVYDFYFSYLSMCEVSMLFFPQIALLQAKSFHTCHQSTANIIFFSFFFFSSKRNESNLWKRHIHIEFIFFLGNIPHLKISTGKRLSLFSKCILHNSFVSSEKKGLNSIFLQIFFVLSYQEFWAYRLNFCTSIFKILWAVSLLALRIIT